MSSGSSCSYLPPPPPYRLRSDTTKSDGVERSMISIVQEGIPRKRHKILRSLSDSKYGTGVTELNPKRYSHCGRHYQPKSSSATSCVVPAGAHSGSIPTTTNNDPYRIYLDTMWNNSRLSLVCFYFKKIQ